MDKLIPKVMVQEIRKTEEPKNKKKRKKKKVSPGLSGIGTVSNKELLLFTKNLAVLIKAGSTLIESISVLEIEAKGRLKFILGRILDHITKGYSFYSALKQYPKVFPNLYTSLVKIGERSGTLQENLDYLTKQLERQQRLKTEVQGALMYPVIVLLGTFTLMIGVSAFVLPKLTTLFKNFKVELPLTTRIVIRVADFFNTYGMWGVIAIISTMLFFIWFVRRPFLQPVTHYLILRIPIASQISKDLNMALFCRTLGILLRTGNTIDDSIPICAETVSNHYYRKFLEESQAGIKSGSTLTALLKSQKLLFKGTDVQIIRIGEESGTLSDSLIYCAAVHEEGATTSTKRLVTILEPLLLVVMGLIVGVLALGIITPIYSITGQFKG